MTAIERVLRAVEEARKFINPMEHGGLTEDELIILQLDAIRDAATRCPRCSFVGDGDCVCPAVRR